MTYRQSQQVLQVQGRALGLHFYYLVGHDDGPGLTGVDRRIPAEKACPGGSEAQR